MSAWIGWNDHEKSIGHAIHEERENDLIKRQLADIKSIYQQKPNSSIPLVLQALTPDHRYITIRIYQTESIRDVKLKVVNSPFDGAVQIGATVYEDDSVMIMKIMIRPGDEVKLIPRLHIKMQTLQGNIYHVDVLTCWKIMELKQFDMPAQPTDPSLIFVYNGTNQLDDTKTFEFEGVKDGDTLRCELAIALIIMTPQGQMKKIQHPKDSVFKAKIESIIAAALDHFANYEIWQNGAPLLDSTLIEQCTQESPLEIRTLDSSVVSEPTANKLLSGAIHSMINNKVPVIPVQESLEMLETSGFLKRHILDPLKFYQLALMRGQLGNVSKKSPFMRVLLVVREFSWGSLEISVSRKDTILMIKKVIEREIDISVNNQQLMYSGAVLADTLTVGQCNLQSGDEIALFCSGANSYFLLPPDLFDSAWDFDYRGYLSQPNFGKRGNTECVVPIGWMRYGLRVKDRYEDNVWLGHVSGPGEWIVSYHGTAIQNAKSIAQDGYLLSKGFRFVYGKGVYSAKHITDAEGYASNFTWQGRRYKIVFMNRVNPDPEKLNAFSEVGYYVSKTDRDIRPYGLLIKEI